MEGPARMRPARTGRCTESDAYLGVGLRVRRCPDKTDRGNEWGKNTKQAPASQPDRLKMFNRSEYNGQSEGIGTSGRGTMPGKGGSKAGPMTQPRQKPGHSWTRG